jgi:low affinity Fe/Cu permease
MAAMSDNTGSKVFSGFPTTIADLSGTPATFALAVRLVVVWAVSGPIFDYSET